MSLQECGLVPKDDFICFFFFDEELGIAKGPHKARTKCRTVLTEVLPVSTGAGTCIGTMRYGDESDTCVIYQAGYPPQGNCKSVMEDLITANKVQEEDVSSHKVESQRRVCGDLRSRTLEE